MKVLSKFILVAVCLCHWHCHSVDSFSMTEIPADRSKRVHAENDKFVFLGLIFDSNYATEVSNQLKAQCEGGQIKGITTKQVFVNYFLGIFSSRQVTASGFCVKA